MAQVIGPDRLLPVPVFWLGHALRVAGFLFPQISSSQL
jgi:hypothetical protein